MSSYRFAGAIEVGTQWELRGGRRGRAPHNVIRLIGPDEPLEGGWLYEYLVVGGRRVTGAKKKRINDDVLRTIYEPTKEEPDASQ